MVPMIIKCRYPNWSDWVEMDLGNVFSNIDSFYVYAAEMFANEFNSRDKDLVEIQDAESGKIYAFRISKNVTYTAKKIY